jgi:hypothetical protein
VAEHKPEKQYACPYSLEVRRQVSCQPVTSVTAVMLDEAIPAPKLRPIQDWAKGSVRSSHLHRTYPAFLAATGRILHYFPRGALRQAIQSIPGP